jgi:hypothetical protein
MNTKAKVLIVAALTAGIFSANLVQAEQDFSQYSNEELVRLRSQAQNMNEGDRAKIQQELQLRMQNMTAAEREQLQQSNKSEEMKLRERLNEDNTQGQGTLERQRDRIENHNGYGKGFDSRHGTIGGSRGR